VIENEAVREGFERQARACSELGSPFTARLCLIAIEKLDPSSPIGALINGWSEERVVADALALRFCGALHALKRQGFAPLVEVYPPQQPSDHILWDAVQRAIDEKADFIAERMRFAPQTNEVRRSAALFPAFSEIAARFPGKPLVLSEIGASAGLNLLWDRFSYKLSEKHFKPNGEVPFEIVPEWNGPLPPDRPVDVAERAGCDLNPLDASNEDHCERLMSYIWADQTDRLQRTEKALALARDAKLSVDREDALVWLQQRLLKPRPGMVHVIYHTTAWQYLPHEAQREGDRLIDEAGQKAGTDAPICRLAMEADEQTPGAGLTLTIWPAGETRHVGRADFHGRWIDWQGWKNT